MKKFLDEIVSFLNELHFICEHSYVLLRDGSIDKETRNSVSNLVKSFEIVSWRSENYLKYGKGMETIEELKFLFNKGLRLMEKLKNIRIDA